MGDYGEQLAWNTALTNGNQIIPQSALYSTTKLGDNEITFEEVPAGTALTDQYRAQGVLFNSTGGNLQVTNANPSQFIPVSGTRQSMATPTRTLARPVRSATFVLQGTDVPASTDFVSLYVINADSVPATVQAFDPAGNLIFDLQCNEGAGTQTRVVIEASAIAKVVVTLGSGADPSAIDNLSFNTPVTLNHPPRPDPGSDDRQQQCVPPHRPRDQRGSAATEPPL